MGDETLDLAHSQVHHAVTNPGMKILYDNVADFNKLKFKRNDFLMLAKNVNAHRGYETWHRILNEEQLNILQKNINKMQSGSYSREDLARDMTKLYQDNRYNIRFGGVAFK